MINYQMLRALFDDESRVRRIILLIDADADTGSVTFTTLPAGVIMLVTVFHLFEKMGFDESTCAFIARRVKPAIDVAVDNYDEDDNSLEPVVVQLIDNRYLLVHENPTFYDIHNCVEYGVLNILPVLSLAFNLSSLYYNLCCFNINKNTNS